MRPSWDEYFMAIAKVVATRSPDEDTKVGCVLVDDRNRIIGTGYNGHPRGIDGKPTSRPDKYRWMIHAEQNAILFATRRLENATVYCTHLPCPNCALSLVAVGIRRIVYDKLTSTPHFGVVYEIIGDIMEEFHG